MNTSATTSAIWKMLAYAYGAVLVVIGLDKVLQTEWITDWYQYVSPFALQVLPITPATLVFWLGIAEILVGFLFFTRYVRVAAAASIVVLLLVVVNLVSLNLYDIAARDALIALGAYAVIRLAALEGYAWGRAV